MSPDSDRIAKEISERSTFLKALITEVESVIVGQTALLRGLLIGLLADGHVLLEGVPGLAKSLSVHTLATALGGTFRRLQFTPDLLPSDVIGTQVYRPETGTWTIREGPIFTNFLLADEINRAPAKVQSALLEAMQERQVTIAGETRALPEPFLVLATQNPVELEGTYPLPEAQVDRFMLKLLIQYPTKEDEKAIVRRMATNTKKPTPKRVVSPKDILLARELLDQIHVDEKILDYVVNLVHASRKPGEVGLGELAPMILYGASPRASIALTQAARAHALLEGRSFVLPKDVLAISKDVLRHRIVTTYEAEAEGITQDHVLCRLLEAVPVP